ncbi:MAG: HTH-type transcriptional regulator Lrp [Halobacteriales archaeon]|nr:HTH-type transcriptional regulator Lrp [Halobacteriales archaeon]
MAYDSLDLKIIESLLEDGRKSLRGIAEELDVSVTTISNHLKSMEEEGVIKGFKPVLNYPELGYTVTSVLMIKAEGDSIKDLVNELRREDALLHVYEVTGDFDVIAIGKFRDTEEMNDTIKELLNSPMVKETNTNVVLSTVKEDQDVEFDY